MHIWHQTPETPRTPHRVSPGEVVRLTIGTWPIEPNQAVWVSFQVAGRDGATDGGHVQATWDYNEGINSYWRAEIGPFARSD